MNAEQAQSLRAEFVPAAIGKLPRTTCKDCSSAREKVCPKHTKSKCADCGNYMTSAHIHLDYVGHAAVTDRLLKVDPDYTWRFLAANPDGSPVVVTAGLSDPVAKVGIWIELVIGDTVTPGFGEGKGFKDAIGDAIRNAAMRRGVALDLWAKEDLHAAQGAEERAREAQEEQAKADAELDALERELLALKPGVQVSVHEHRLAHPAEGHLIWLRRCIEAATEPAGDPEAASALTDKPVTEAPGARSGQQPSPADAQQGPSPGVPPAPAASPFQQPADVGDALKPAVSFAKNTSQRRTLEKLNVLVVAGRKAGVFATEDVYQWARDLDPLNVRDDAYYIGEDGKLHWTDLRSQAPVWLCSQLLDRLKLEFPEWWASMERERAA